MHEMTIGPWNNVDSFEIASSGTSFVQVQGPEGLQVLSLIVTLTFLPGLKACERFKEISSYVHTVTLITEVPPPS